MIGMTFLPFLMVSVIAIVVALIYHYGVQYRFLDTADAYFGKVIVGWIGAWLGSPILGHWFWKVEGVYVLPAVLGAVAAIHLNVLLWKALRQIALSRPAATETRPMKTAAAA